MDDRDQILATELAGFRMETIDALRDIAASISDLVRELRAHRERQEQRPVNQGATRERVPEDDLPFVRWKKVGANQWRAVEIPKGAAASTCGDCGVRVYWCRNKRSGKKVSIDDSGQMHLQVCPAKHGNQRGPAHGGESSGDFGSDSEVPF